MLMMLMLSSGRANLKPWDSLPLSASEFVEDGCPSPPYMTRMFMPIHDAYYAQFIHKSVVQDSS
jgi:hypothetical protein